MEPARIPEELFGATVTVVDSELARPPSATVAGGENAGLWMVGTEDHAWLRLSGIGTFVIRSGTEVRVSPDPSISARRLADWTRGMVAAVLLAQQGRFALHASAVDVGPSGALAVAGPSGAGKSTTALTLTRLGHSLLSDDVTVVDTVGASTVASGSGRSLYLWPDAVEALALDPTAGERVTDEVEKIAMPLARTDGRGRPLSCVVVLSGDTGAGPTAVRRVRPVTAVGLVVANTYRWELLRPLYRTEIFRWAADVASTTPVHSLRRPTGGWTADAVADAVLALVPGGGSDR